MNTSSNAVFYTSVYLCYFYNQPDMATYDISVNGFYSFACLSVDVTVVFVCLILAVNQVGSKACNIVTNTPRARGAK